jgi:hypothetical protein
MIFGLTRNGRNAASEVTHSITRTLRVLGDPLGTHLRRGSDFDTSEAHRLLIIVGVGCAGRHGLGGRLRGLRLPRSFPPL